MNSLKVFFSAIKKFFNFITNHPLLSFLAAIVPAISPFIYSFLNPKVEDLTYVWESNQPKLTWNAPICRLVFCISKYQISRNKNIVERPQETFFEEQDTLEDDKHHIYEVRARNRFGILSDPVSIEIVTQPKAPEPIFSLPPPGMKTIKFEWSEINNNKGRGIYYVIDKEVDGSFDSSFKTNGLVYSEDRTEEDLFKSVSYWFTTIRKETDANGNIIEIQSHKAGPIRIPPISRKTVTLAYTQGNDSEFPHLSKVNLLETAATSGQILDFLYFGYECDLEKEECDERSPIGLGLALPSNSKGTFGYCREIWDGELQFAFKRKKLFISNLFNGQEHCFTVQIEMQQLIGKIHIQKLVRRVGEKSIKFNFSSRLESPPSQTHFDLLQKLPTSIIGDL